MPLSRHFKMPTIEPDVEDATLPETDVAMEDVVIPTTEVDSSIQPVDKQALAAYLAKWEAVKGAKEPKRPEPSMVAPVMKGLATASNLLANIKDTPKPYDMSFLDEMEADEMARYQDKMKQYRTDQALGMDALGKAVGLEERMRKRPFEERMDTLRQQEAELGMDVKRGEFATKQATENEKADPKSGISQQYRALAAELGFKGVPENVSAAQLEKQLPVMKDIYIARENKRAKAEAAKRKTQVTTFLDAEGKPVSALVDMETGEIVKQLGAPIPKAGAVVKPSKLEMEAQAAEAAATAMDSWANEAKALRQQATMAGPIAGRISKAAGSLGFVTDPKTAELDVQLQKRLNSYIQQISGAAVTAAEEKRLKAVLPSITDTEEMFSIRLADAIREAKAIANERLLAAGKTKVGEQSPAMSVEKSSGRIKKKASDLPDLNK